MVGLNRTGKREIDIATEENCGQIILLLGIVTLVSTRIPYTWGLIV